MKSLLDVCWRLMWAVVWLVLGISLVLLLSLVGLYAAGRGLIDVRIALLLTNICALILPAVVGATGICFKMSRDEGRVVWVIVLAITGAALGTIANGKIDSFKRISFLRGFETSLLGNKNVNDVQKWAFTTLESNGVDDEQMRDVNVPGWLLSLFRRRAPDVYVFRERSVEEKYVKVVWGGGFQHWGMMIGSDEYLLTSGPSQLLRPLKPGVYLYVDR